MFVIGLDILILLMFWRNCDFMKNESACLVGFADGYKKYKKKRQPIEVASAYLYKLIY